MDHIGSAIKQFVVGGGGPGPLMALRFYTVLCEWIYINATQIK
jgi:hypothetical protein